MEQRVRLVVVVRATDPVELLDVCAGQAQTSCGEVLLGAHEIVGRRGGRRAPGLPLDPPAERLLLQVEEARRPLYLRQHLRWRRDGGL